MIAALLFFVLQALAFVALRGLELSPVRMVSFAFAIAGGVTYGLMRFFYWRLRTAGVPRILDAGAPRALLLGLAGGGAAAVCGLAYIAIASRLDLLPQLRLPDDKTQTPLIWLGLLAVLAAPVFEEFIFRGLIFGGLRRTYGVTASMLASAAIFAIIHPPLSVVPVFLMALCAAYVYERSRMLIAPMLVHAIYNAVVLGVQWGFMQ